MKFCALQAWDAWVPPIGTASGTSADTALVWRAALTTASLQLLQLTSALPPRAGDPVGLAGLLPGESAASLLQRCVTSLQEGVAQLWALAAPHTLGACAQLMGCKANGANAKECCHKTPNLWKLE